MSVVGQLVATVMLTRLKWSLSSATIVPALIGSFSCLLVSWLFYNRQSIRWIVGVPLLAFTFVLACFLWVMDKRDSPISICEGPQSRSSVLQGHAVFHALTAACIAIAYFVLRSIALAQ